MPIKRLLPDDVPEIGYIYISLGLDAEGGTTVAWDYQGIPIGHAIGELIALSDVLRDEIRGAWDDTPNEEFE